MIEDVVGFFVGFDKLVFFCNLGIEVNEVVMKFVCKIIGCFKMVIFYNSFYGWIYGVMFLIGNEVIKVGYVLLVLDVIFGDYNSNLVFFLIDD